jgi:hypothetical protein
LFEPEAAQPFAYIHWNYSRKACSGGHYNLAAAVCPGELAIQSGTRQGVGFSLRRRQFTDMGAHIDYPISKGIMKTTVEISDPLLREVRELAAREGVTLRTLVERGLHRVVAETKRSTPFKLRRASFKGNGRQAELDEASWDRLRDLIYRDRGA